LSDVETVEGEDSSTYSMVNGDLPSEAQNDTTKGVSLEGDQKANSLNNSVTIEKNDFAVTDIHQATESVVKENAVTTFDSELDAPLTNSIESKVESNKKDSIISDKKINETRSTSAEESKTTETELKKIIENDVDEEKKHHGKDVESYDSTGSTHLYNFRPLNDEYEIHPEGASIPNQDSSTEIPRSDIEHYEFNKEPAQKKANDSSESSRKKDNQIVKTKIPSEGEIKSSQFTSNIDNNTELKILDLSQSSFFETVVAIGTDDKSGGKASDDKKTIEDKVCRPNRHGKSNPRHCYIPFMYLLAPVCRKNTKDCALFDVQGLTDMMMQ